VETRRANEADQDALVDGGVVGLVLVGAMIDTGAIVEQKVIDAGCASVNSAITRGTRCLALSTNAVDCGLGGGVADAALALAGGVDVENKASLARGAGVDVPYASDAVLLASLACSGLIGTRRGLVDLDIWEASFEAFLVEGVETHVVLAGGAAGSADRAGLAGGIALLACSTSLDAVISRTARTAFVPEEVARSSEIATGAVSGLIIASCAALLASGAPILAGFVDIATWAIGNTLKPVRVEEQMGSFTALGTVAS
jgi:hypothetical protein